MMRVSQVIKQNVVDSSTFKELPPQHKDVVTDFYNMIDYDFKMLYKKNINN